MRLSSMLFAQSKPAQSEEEGLQRVSPTARRLLNQSRGWSERTRSTGAWLLFALCLALPGIALAQNQTQTQSQTQPQSQSQTQTQAATPSPDAASSQTPNTTSAPTPSVFSDPTQPETQPSLLVDRDPVLSPDYEDDAPVSATIPLAPARAAEIEKLRGGHFVLHESVDEVVLNCTVVDKHGQVVNGLTEKDFHVWEDGVPQPVISVLHEDLPVSMGILIDNSGSMSDKQAAVDEAALDLVRASNPGDEAFIVNFSDEAYLDQGFTSNIQLLERGLSHIEARGGTALYDAIVASANELARYAKHPKQVLLVVTDGEDDASMLTLQQAIERVQALHGPEIYAIGLLYDDSGPEAHRARQALELLTEQTGGLAYFPRSLQNVSEIAGEVASDIRNQYTVAYHPTRPIRLGGYRTVRVEASAPGHKHLIVRTRSGYLAVPNAGTATN